MKQAIMIALLAVAIPAVGNGLPPEKNTCIADFHHQKSCNIIEHTPLEQQLENSFGLLKQTLTAEQAAALADEQAAWLNYVAKKQAWTAGQTPEQIRAELKSRRSAELRSAAESRYSSPQQWLQARSSSLAKDIGGGYRTDCIRLDMGAYQSHNCDWQRRRKL